MPISTALVHVYLLTRSSMGSSASMRTNEGRKRRRGRDQGARDAGDLVTHVRRQYEDGARRELPERQPVDELERRQPVELHGRFIAA